MMPKLIAMDNKQIIIDNNIIMIKDLKSGGYTAFFKDYPEIIAEGDTKKEAYKNLSNAKHDVDEYRHKIERDIQKDINL